MSHPSSSTPSTTTHKAEDEKMGLNTLPYDLLLNIASYLELRDIHALHLVSSLFLSVASLFFFLFCSDGFLDQRGAVKEMDTPRSGWAIGRVRGVTSFVGDRITWKLCQRCHWLTCREAFEE
jgi:hypothetical protein